MLKDRKEKNFSSLYNRPNAPECWQRTFCRHWWLLSENRLFLNFHFLFFPFFLEMPPPPLCFLIFFKGTSDNFWCALPADAECINARVHRCHCSSAIQVAVARLESHRQHHLHGRHKHRGSSCSCSKRVAPRGTRTNLRSATRASPPSPKFLDA